MAASKPNIIWIVTTQWRAQSCGYTGDPNVQTPFLDQLAAKSIDYTQAVTPHPFGPFARAALLTGKPSPENGVEDYYDPLPEDSRTIAHEMADQGYRTAYFGKWHLAPKDREAALVGEVHAKTIVPENKRGGFDFWEGFEGGFQLNDPWLHGTVLPRPIQCEGYQSSVVSERASDWSTDEGVTSAPWFAVVSLEAPHPPYAVDADGVVGRGPSGLELRANVPLGGDIEARARRELAGYGAHIEATDRAIGNLLQRLPMDDTIVVFTSVHGDMHGSQGLFRKGWPYEESVRVPLLVRYPQSPSRRVADPVSLLSLSEMTRAWARGEEWKGSGEYAAISMPSVVALPDQGDCRWRGIRGERYKLVVRDENEPWLLFDLQSDPSEQRNLIDDPKSFGLRDELISRLSD
ncbi:MAG: sulfatase [Opitutaceae bacterium]|nr:sulfatase [Opitutaceae bacterium]|tara:strand:- start:6212 stop:7426 length:1215 start_codon:yes stop_codon:yes gene_type:complete